MSYSVFMNSIDKLLYKGVEKTCKIVIIRVVQSESWDIFGHIPCYILLLKVSRLTYIIVCYFIDK